MNTAQRPVALSCGEPAGIGPEIAAKAWMELRQDCPFVWIGDPRHLPSGVPVQAVQDPQEALSASASALPVLVQEFAGNAAKGSADPRNAAGVIRSIERAVELVKQGSAAAVCTAPIHKKALIDGADFAYPGHTEFLAALCADEPGEPPRSVMMLWSEGLAVVPVTVHIPLAAVPAQLTRELIVETWRIVAHDLHTRFLIDTPRLALAGLNPHAGEAGTMGREEIDVIAPAIAQLQAEGIDARGPFPGDTLFHARARAGYDAVLCMYHDQALIPIKTIAFDEAVNVTLGLPFLRVSPDHGTAFDIAGKGVARPDSLIAALRLGARLAAGKA